MIMMALGPIVNIASFSNSSFLLASHATGLSMLASLYGRLCMIESHVGVLCMLASLGASLDIWIERCNNYCHNVEM